MVTNGATARPFFQNSKDIKYEVNGQSVPGVVVYTKHSVN